MDFLKNVYDYFRGSNTKRQDEIKFIPNVENYSQNIPEEIPRVKMDVELPEDFIISNFGGNKPHDDDGLSGFHFRENVPLFGEFSSLFQLIGQFGEAMREIERQFSGPVEFHNFPEGNFGDMRDDTFREPEKTLSGEKLRNYYLSGNNIEPHQGENQLVTLNDKKFDNHQTDLFINNNNNRSDFTTTPYFKSQSHFVVTKIGPDGIAEITKILRDESGNEERTVRKVKLF